MISNNLKSGKPARYMCLIAAITLLLTVGLFDSALAVTADEIDKRSDDALKRLYGLEGGKEFADKAAGLLIMPKVGKGALIVGFEHGKGALRIDGKTVDYYSLTAGSVGLQLGGEAKAIIIAFMTKESLEKFRASKNWEAGWTIATALAHLAYWDQRSLMLMRKWQREGVELSPIDIDVTNDSLLPLLLAIPPGTAAELAVSSAEAIDRELEKASSELIVAIEGLGEDFRLYRSIHRKLHLDEIEDILKNKETY